MSWKSSFEPQTHDTSAFTPFEHKEEKQEEMRVVKGEQHVEERPSWWSNLDTSMQHEGRLN